MSAQSERQGAALFTTNGGGITMVNPDILLARKEVQMAINGLKIKTDLTLEQAAREALAHCEELSDAWMRGCISEHDGKGGTRSNRNHKVEMDLRQALRGDSQ